jgi:hypothetical protein
LESARDRRQLADRALCHGLAAVDATLVAHLLSAGRVHALVATGRRGLVTDLGPATPFVELHHRLRADLDVLATGTVPAPIRASVRVAWPDDPRRRPRFGDRDRYG